MVLLTFVKSARTICMLSSLPNSEVQYSGENRNRSEDY